jgi:hypothetical protein
MIPSAAPSTSNYVRDTILEQVARTQIWHTACTHIQRPKLKSTVVGCGEGNARKIAEV